ncbi:hypothetical protein D584_22961 [Brucella intermedia M86]|uniref:Uncharacterized protein n=3 Tax=Brucella intermedia TaxID=94625 RepID=U4V630_9HYPH|nr:hypothetical protein [Brucella intermedia]ELT46803.1 hypothetical protein D584_22961 [Brucella intermedia M86]ERM00483.1 hypothetical protein Q644_04815 [Brucella intermedia 229E]OOC57850.1 hypothetical protein AS855_06080 [Brucella intermedia M86]
MMKNLDSACTTATASAISHATESGWSALFSRLFSFRRTRVTINEYSPEYLLRDIGIGDGRTQYYSRDGHKLPEWR